MSGLRCSLLLLALASGACYAPEPAAGAPCGPGDVCPAGLACIAGACTTGTGNGSDGGLADAATDGELDSGTDVTCEPSGVPRAALLTSMIVGDNSNEGNMFDVVAAETITITSFETHADTTGQTDYEIWTRPGTYVGFADSASGWTRIGTATFTAAGEGAFSQIPIPINVTIDAGQRRAFYLTNRSSNNRYHDGTQVGAPLASTPELAIYEGAGVNFGSDGFSGTSSPRAWEGKIHYRKGGGTTLATPMAGGTSSNGVMFDVTPARDLQVAMLAVHLGAGTHDVEVYFRRGSFAGAETTAAQWTPLATIPNVVSAGASTPTMLPMPVDVLLGSGATTAFYVASDDPRLRSQAVTGSVAASNADLVIGQGVQIDGSFGSVAGAVTPNIALGYGVCN